MKSLIPFTMLLILCSRAGGQVGIGTTTPNQNAVLHLEAGTTKGLLVTGTGTGDLMPSLSHGTRMMFFPFNGAFRVGYANFDYWDGANVGDYSVAMGYAGRAKGDYSTAIGFNAQAMGHYSTCLGYTSEAGGDYSFSIGNLNFVTGSRAIAIGSNLQSSGNYSIALGSYVNTSGFEGSLTIGDRSTTNVMQTFVSNGMRCRFANGYRFFTNADANIGALLNGNQNAWSTLSDIRLKENFLPVDGEEFLTRIAGLPQYSWNYKGQDPKILRHYGPMAQDFYKAFGRDELGTIGDDTTINQADFDGVNLIAIQALERRTSALQKENSELKARLERLEKLLAVKEN